jgi:colanic acid/amylovoran biosynthesis glycosyltransferase
MNVAANLRLLYLVPEFPSQTHAFFWREVQALQARGVEVILVSTRRPPADACRHDFAQTAAQQTHYLFPPDWLADAWFLLVRPRAFLRGLRYVIGLRESSALRRLMTVPLALPAAGLSRLALRMGANHLHVHSFANSAHVAAMAKVMGGCDYSLTLHGDLEVYGRDHASKTGLAKFVTCVTEPLRLQVMSIVGLPATMVHLLWMGVDTQRFQPSTKPVRQASQPIRLLTVARLHVNKGHRFALRALKLLTDQGLSAKYIVVGDGPARGEIEQEVQLLGLGGTVDLVGTRSECEVLELLRNSDALLLTSIGMGEAAPVAVMEAMACGLPVVCSIIGGTRDMIRHGQDGFLVEQEDVDGIAHCIRRLIEDPELGGRMGNAARARAEQVFDSGALAESLLELIAAPAAVR